MENQVLPRQIPYPLPVQHPRGLETLYRILYRNFYPDQPNPLQVTAKKKYWQGGPDPLDHISMYENDGDPERNIPPHWHYISFGLSDLHGDGRVHYVPSADNLSGYGFELTFRLKRDPAIPMPPTWPAAVMQALAKYVFQSDITFYAGDHVSWHCPLDNSNSKIQHMLLMEDPQLKTVDVPFGSVAFIQIVGVFDEELQAAQGWNGGGVIDLMKTVDGAGGPWLITDMKRSATIFELDSTVRTKVNEGVARDGSNLSAVSAHCSWHEEKACSSGDACEEEVSLLGCEFERTVQISAQETEQIKATLKKGLLNTKPVLPQIAQPSCSSQQDKEPGASRKESFDNNMNDEGRTESRQAKFIDSVHLHLNLEAGTILPLALRGGLRHGRHFTFESVVGEYAITILPVTVTGAFVDVGHPYAAYGPWLQVLLKDEDIDEMLHDLNEISELDAIALPKTFEWCHKTLIVTLMHDSY